MIINPKVVKKGISEEQLEAWAEVNTALEEAVGVYKQEIVPTSAAYFTFEGSTVTGWVGPDEVTEIIIPKSYSTISTIETVVGAKVLDKSEIRYIIRDFRSATFSDGGTNTQTYTSTSQLQNLSSDFPNDCYLISMQGSNPFSFDFLQMASDMQLLQFPIVINGKTFNNGMSAFDYIKRNDITNVNFDGEVEVIKFVDGDDYQVTSVGGFAFSRNENIASVIMPNTIKQILEEAFYGCSNLSNIEFSNKLEIIARSAFAFNSAIISINLPASLTKIEDTAFFNCNGLTSITIPDSVTSIGERAFYKCSSLTTMTILATTPPTLSNTNAISSATTQIQVPMVSVEAYKTATNWSRYADQIQPLSEKGGAN